MTLIEVLIVLALLAGLASMALVSMEDLSSRSRYDITIDRMEKIQAVIAGDGLNLGRFVADMGRLPVIQDYADGKVLSELWTAPSALEFASTIPSSLSWPAADIAAGISFPAWSEFNLHCGWNGPYLVGNNPLDQELYDGFGNDWIVETNGTSGEIELITSHGSNGEEGGGSSWTDEDQTLVLTNSYSPATLKVVLKAKDLSAAPIWSSVVPAPVWASGVSIGMDDCTVDSTGAYVFKCTVTNTTSGTEPAWDTAAVGNITTDSGGVSWEYLGTVASGNFNHYINRLRVALFIPDVGLDAPDVGWVTAFLGDTGNSEEPIASATILFDDLAIAPGVRKIYAYGFLAGQTTPLTIGEPETIELHPGQNFITLYLQ